MGSLGKDNECKGKWGREDRKQCKGMAYWCRIQINDEQWGCLAGILEGVSSQLCRQSADWAQRDYTLKPSIVRKNREGTSRPDSILISFPVFLWCAFMPEEANSTHFRITLHDPWSNHCRSQTPMLKGWHFIWDWQCQRIQRQVEL